MIGYLWQKRIVGLFFWLHILVIVLGTNAVVYSFDTAIKNSSIIMTIVAMLVIYFVEFFNNK